MKNFLIVLGILTLLYIIVSMMRRNRDELKYRDDVLYKKDVINRIRNRTSDKTTEKAKSDIAKMNLCNHPIINRYIDKDGRLRCSECHKVIWEEADNERL